MGGFEQRMMRSPLGDGGEPFFATGDLGRMEADGCLVHQGRMDRLLKIRGQRVEPAVVEASLMDHPRVVRCAVAAIGSGSKEKRLAAYYVRGEGAEAGGAELREYLKERLPASHLPTWIVPVEEIPLTSNGKIDYQSLPDPTQLTEGDHTAAAARDGVELVLIRIWERVLRIKQPGVEEDFFELGGDSLLAALMLSRVEAKLKVDLPMAHFCDEATIRGLAELVRRRGSDAGYARLVPLSDGEGGLPYFSVPGAGADVAVIKTERWVPLGRPVYGMQYRGIDGVEHPHETVEEIATYLVEEIRKVQPEGPYHLGGASFGGLVAYEAARQLRGLGEETALLVLADTRVSGHAKPRKGTGIAGSVERALLRLLPVGEQVALTKDSIRGALRQARYRVSVPLMRWRCKREGRPLPKVYRFYELLNRAVAAKRRYEVKAYDGPVTLFRFSEQAPDRLFEVDPTLGWGPYCPNLEIRDLPGAHGDLGRDPEATECFYRNLKELLE